MAEELLRRPDVMIVFEQVGGEGVLGRVAGDPLRDPRPPGRVLHGTLQDMLVEVPRPPCGASIVRPGSRSKMLSS